VRAFKISRFTFHLEAKESISLPPFKGSTLRGAFGHAFKNTACALKRQKCDSCILSEKCIYSYVFETPPPSDTAIMRKYPRAPHPFVLEPPEDERTLFSKGERIVFGLVLIGKAIEYIPYFIYSFDVLGEMGIGKGNGKFALKEVHSCLHGVSQRPENTKEDPVHVVYDDTSKKIERAPISVAWEDLVFDLPQYEKTTLHFHTPTRIKYNGRYTSELEFHIMLRNLLRRISSLSYFHCDETLDLDFGSLIEMAQDVSVENSALTWYDWERYSASQRTRMKLGGFVGSITFRGDLKPFWPFLVLGQHIHVGKNTAFGLGRYEIQQT
jgi:hypothetical protein